MNYTIKKLPKSEVELKITVSEETLVQARKKACEDISKEVKIKGFRPGHIPQNVLEEYVDKKYIEAHTHERAIQKSYSEAVLKENLQVVSRPEVKIESENPLVYTATVAVMPEVEIKGYKDIKIKKEEVKVTEKEIEEVLGNMKKHSTTYKDIEREVKKGDRVEVDFEGFDEKDVALENTKSQNHPVIIGENSLIPGFEDELIGLKKDEKKEFKITFPKDYHKKDFQNKKVTFKVEIKRIEEPVIPEINEEFIEKMTGKKQTVEDFKKEIEENLKAKKEQEAKQKHENDYIEELLKKMKVELPDALIKEESYYILQDIKEDIEHKGYEFTKFLEKAKTTEEQLLEKYKEEAERRIKIRMALQHLLKEEDIKVEDSEIQKDLEQLKSYYPEKEHAVITKEFENGKLKSQIISKLALKKLFEKVLS